MSSSITFVSAVSAHNLSESATLKLVVGVQTSPKTGKDSPVYASIKVPGNGMQTREDALSKLAALRTVAGIPIPLNVKCPNMTKGATLQIVLPRSVPSDVACILFACYGGLSVPASLTNDRISDVLSTSGWSKSDIAEYMSAFRNIKPTKAPSKPRKVKKAATVPVVVPNATTPTTVPVTI